MRGRMTTAIATVGTAAVLTLGVLTTVGCTPTVKVSADEPITINLNVNIKHEIRIKID